MDADESDGGGSDSGDSECGHRFDEISVPTSLVAHPHTVSVDQLHSIYMTYAPSGLGLVVLDAASSVSLAKISSIRRAGASPQQAFFGFELQLPGSLALTTSQCA